MKKLLFLSILLFLPLVGSGEITKDEKDPTAIICTGEYSKRYHKSICRGMKSCKGETKKVTLSEAKKRKLTPCGYCYKRK